MNKIYIVIIFIFFSCSLKSQVWQWAVKGGGNSNDAANVMDVDVNGNSFVAGKYYDTISFGTTSLYSPGTWSIYVAKYDVNGNFIWAKNFASDSAINVRGICISKNGYISITGEYFNTGLFGFPNSINLSSSADFDVFVARYDNAGNIQWARTLGGIGVDFGGGISVDDLDNVYITGDFHLSSFHASSAKVIVAKYDISGNQIWIRMPKSYGNFHYGMGIKTDDIGNSYIVGQFFNTLVFDTLKILNAGNIECNIYLAKFDTQGDLIWIQKAGSPAGYAGGEAIDIDALGNSYITGFYRGQINLGPLILTGPGTISYDVFFAKCDTSGNFVWANSINGPGSLDEGRCICVDNAGSCYISGYFYDSTTADLSTVHGNGGQDIFICKSDTAGNVEWMTRCGSSLDDKVGEIKADAQGVFICGSFQDTSSFPGLTSLMSVNNSYDIFTGRIAGTTLNISKEEKKNNPLVYPNPSSNEIKIKGIDGEFSYVIYDVVGKIAESGSVYSSNIISVENIPTGINFISITNKKDESKITFKFLKE